jgi:hypothetical protein
MCRVMNVYREQVFLDGIKGSKKGESRYKTMNGKIVYKHHFNRRLQWRDLYINNEIRKLNYLDVSPSPKSSHIISAT